MIDHNGSRGMNRRKFLQIAGPGLALTNASQSLPASASSTTPGMFPFGTHIYREPSLPLEQIREDLPLLKKLGFNMVKIQESWAIDEQKEGEIDLSKVSRVVSDARQVGLGVYFGVTMEQAPAWFWRKFPDAYLVYNTGEPHNDQLQYVIPADGKPGPCWHHPGARNAASRFLGAVGREVGQYDNILVWNVWQEIGFWPMRPRVPGLLLLSKQLAGIPYLAAGPLWIDRKGKSGLEVRICQLRRGDPSALDQRSSAVRRFPLFHGRHLSSVRPAVEGLRSTIRRSAASSGLRARRRGHRRQRSAVAASEGSGFLRRLLLPPLGPRSIPGMPAKARAAGRSIHTRDNRPSCGTPSCCVSTIFAR
jgi:hypothetical protein